MMGTWDVRWLEPLVIVALLLVRLFSFFSHCLAQMTVGQSFSNVWLDSLLTIRNQVR